LQILGQNHIVIKQYPTIMKTTKRTLILLLILGSLAIFGCSGPHEIGASNKKVGCGYSINMSGY